MDFSGEQFVPGTKDARIEADHLSRYQFSQPYIQKKRVLDLACGTGYGAKSLLDSGASEVFGVDISPEAISYAQSHFQASNLTFQLGSAEKLPFDNSFFDVVTSFETIEHLDKEIRSKYLQELRRVLKDDGTILISTPNRRITSPCSKTPLNKYHVIEYSVTELVDILKSSGFQIVELMGQRMVHKFFIPCPVRKLVGAIQLILGKDFSLYHKANGPKVTVIPSTHEPRYLFVQVKK